MDFFDSTILSIEDIFFLMNKPRDLSQEEFVRLAAMCSVKPWRNSISTNNVGEVVQEAGIAATNSEVRRMIKAQSLAIGKKKVNDPEAKLTPEDFFETGFEDWKWTTVKNGKKTHRVILWPSDLELSE